MNTRVRFPELDLLRFLAACGVMLFHFTYYGPQNHLWPGSFPILSQIFKYGFMGVDVFFILSGFVILLTAYEKDAIAFTVARICRLYPAYWICVTLTALAIVGAGSVHASVTPLQYLANMTMGHEFLGIRDVSGVYWTLSVELQFYFLIFIVLATGQIRRLGYLLGLWLLASVILSLRAPHGILHFLLFPEWSSYFIAGAMLFLIHREGSSPYKLFVIAGCYVLSVAYAIKLLPFGGARLESDQNALVIACVLAAAYLTFLLIALKPRTNQGSNPFYLLGLVTYPLYLLHQDIGYILLRLAPAGVNRVLLLCIVMAAMIALSWLVHIGPEKWLAPRLKSLLARPHRLAVLVHSVISERLAHSGPKSAPSESVVPTVIPVPVSTLAAMSQATQSPTTDSGLAKQAGAS